MPRFVRPVTRGRGASRALAAMLAVALGGCGAQRAQVADQGTPAPAQASKPAFFPLAGLNLQVPRNWTVVAGAAPLVATITSGQAVIAVWRYPRTEPLPAGRAALRLARRGLIAAARARDTAMKLLGTRTLRVSGAPAIQLLADEHISGHARRVRSTHVFAHAGELVFDAYAPDSDFALADVTVFQPVLASARVRAPRRP